MKIVLNRCYGGYSLSDDACKKLNVDDKFSFDVDRMNERLVAVVEENHDLASGKHADLRVVEFPDEATDYFIDSHDGFETLLYVLNGKIRSE